MKNVAFALALALMASGCQMNGDDYAPPSSKRPLVAMPRPPVKENPLLKNKDYLDGNRYVAEGKLFYPKGQNAVESFLKARQSFATKQDGLEEALREMEPYLVMAIDTSMAQNNQAEAVRLTTFLRQINPKAAALPRLDKEVLSSTSDSDLVNPLAPPPVSPPQKQLPPLPSAKS